MALGALLAAAACASAWPAAALARSDPDDAPLDSLVEEGAAVARKVAAETSTRRVLPDVPALGLPRSEAPERPPRLDDPAAAEQELHLAETSLAAADYESAMRRVQAAVAADPGFDRARWWAAGAALRRLDLPAAAGLLPAAARASLANPLAWRRLLLAAHQGLLLYLLLLWALLIAALMFRYREQIGHDLGVLLLRRGHVPRPALALLLPVAVLLLRPGWPAAAALLSLPLMLLARGRERVLLSAVWLGVAALLVPGWPLLREAAPALDPGSETCLLDRACRQEARGDLISALQARLARADDPARNVRLQFALAVQKARQGDYEASSRLFRGVLRAAPDHVPSLVGLANNTYYQGAYDAAIEDYRRAERLAPARPEIGYNLAQAYFKKLFLPEASEALKRSRDLGFEAPAWSDGGKDGTGFAPVVYLGLEPVDLAASARLEAGLYPALPHLWAWHIALGGEPAQVAFLLGASLLASLLMAAWLAHAGGPRVCRNCGRAICRTCGRARERNWLCAGCAETASRSRSEFVLSTVLKNRSRDPELARAVGLRRFGRLLPGGGQLAAGRFAGGLFRLLLLALALFLLLAGWSFDPAARWPSPGLLLPEETLHPVWLPLPAAAAPQPLSMPLLAGAGLLLLLILGAQLDPAGRQGLPESFRERERGPAPRAAAAARRN